VVDAKFQRKLPVIVAVFFKLVLCTATNDIALTPDINIDIETWLDLNRNIGNQFPVFGITGTTFSDSMWHH
jgi:hypothetical protein